VRHRADLIPLLAAKATACLRVTEIKRDQKRALVRPLSSFGDDIVGQIHAAVADVNPRPANQHFVPLEATERA
jgi:hypothetical protein